MRLSPWAGSLLVILGLAVAAGPSRPAPLAWPPAPPPPPVGLALEGDRLSWQAGGPEVTAYRVDVTAWQTGDHVAYRLGPEATEWILPPDAPRADCKRRFAVRYAVRAVGRFGQSAPALYDDLAVCPVSPAPALARR